MAFRSSFTAVSSTFPSTTPSPPFTSQHQSLLLLPLLTIRSSSRTRSPLRSSRRVPNHPLDAVVVDPRAWREIGSLDDNRDYDSEDDEEEEDDRSLDLLVRFLHNVFGKVSRRARRAARSVLPVSIPTRLVGFSVNGVLILAFLWILKAFLEVVCTFGSMVFVSILLVRGIWSCVSYLQESRFSQINRFDGDTSAWNGAQPAT